eukprot:4035102-Alexandrium_andersonii.AAC.1
MRVGLGITSAGDLADPDSNRNRMVGLCRDFSLLDAASRPHKPDVQKITYQAPSAPSGLGH